MKTIPFHYEHLKVMDMREYEKEKVYPYMLQAQLDVFNSLPYNYTIIKDGKIITCAGIVPLWEGVYEVWQIPSIYVKDYKAEYVKIMIDLFMKVAENLKAHRFQSACPADALHDRWMKFTGFELEGTLKEYNRFKEDYRMWARRFVWE